MSAGQCVTTTAMNHRKYWRLILIWGLGLVVSLLVHEYTNLDFWIQDFFFNRQTDNWWVAARDPIPRFVFYNLPKWCMIITTVCIGFWIGSDLLGKRHNTRQSRARMVLFISLIATPAVVGLIKKYSGVWCPSELTRYGGEHVFRYLFQSQPANEKVGHCFPAGHASAGFGFLALYYLPNARETRRLLGLLGMSFGWIMGLYQMFKGAHFLTHTTTTMCIAGLIVITAARFLALPDDAINE